MIKVETLVRTSQNIINIINVISYIYSFIAGCINCK